MDKKEQFDSFLRLAEFQQVSLERRIGIEWKMTTVLWTAIFLGTWYLKINQFDLPKSAILFYIGFLIVYSVWLGFLGRANFIDKSFKEYYRNEAEQVLAIEIGRIKHPAVRKKLYWGAWLWLEIILTGGFLLVSYFFVTSL
jgi:hypothetical protein